MSTAPVTLDFSRAQPVAPTPQPVTLDFANAKPLTDTPLTPEQTRSRTLQNVTAAMSGQPQSTPEDQAQFEAGKKSGAINAAVDTGLGALGGVAIPKGFSAIEGALKYLGLGPKVAPEAKEVATGLFDQFGRPLMNTLAEESKPVVNQIITHPAVQEAMKKAAKNILGGTVAAVGGHYGLKALEYLLKSE